MTCEDLKELLTGKRIKDVDIHYSINSFCIKEIAFDVKVVIAETINQTFMK